MAVPAYPPNNGMRKWNAPSHPATINASAMATFLSAAPLQMLTMKASIETPIARRIVGRNSIPPHITGSIKT